MVEFDEVIVPVDGSEGSGRAARFAARLAAATQCPLKLMYVLPASSALLMSMAKLSAEEIKQIEHNAAREAIESARTAMGDTGATAEEVVAMGDPAEEIITYVDSHPKSLVVMGRRGLSRIQTLMLGSVSEKVMRHAKGAVTLVH